MAGVLAALLLASCQAGTDAVLDLSASGNGPRYGDTDPHEWEGTPPWAYPVHGIDVAKYQGTIDWQTVRRASIAFAFIKATEGGDLLDDRFMENWQGARKAGVPRGAYHFYYFCRPAHEQARWFIRNVPRERGALPPVLDMEWNHKSPSCKLRPPAPTVRREMEIYLTAMRRHYGQRPVIYTTVDFYRDNQLWLIEDHEFWLRSVAGHPSQVYPGQEWRFWQYTGTGVIPGIEGDTDINVFNGSPQEWENWLKERAG